MEDMTGTEWRDFVSVGTRTGKLATVMSDGRPRNGVATEVLVRISPTRVVAKAGVAD